MGDQLNILPLPNQIARHSGNVSASNIDLDAVTVLMEETGHPEGYILEIQEDGITIQAGTECGVFYGKQTLKQLMAVYDEIPCVRIQDEPAFRYRGAMLDCARHMLALDEIKQFVDALALMKMNVLHWHLTDDQGWRIELDSYPLLVEIGSKRKSSDFGAYHFAEEYGGYYSKKEIREIVAYCAERHIDVIPEIDLPGHTTCAISAYPELSCRGEKIEVGVKEGVYEDILCVGKEETMDFVFQLLEEIIPLFPSQYFHIGGDEVPKKRWKECPHCQKRMKDNQLNNEEELQGWFNKQLVAFFKQHGKTAVLWNEGLYNGIMGPDDIVAQRWHDIKYNATKTFAQQGGKIILSDTSHHYFDYPYGMISLKKCYQFNPYFLGLSEEQNKNIMGIEAPIWTEYVRDFRRFGYMTFPRYCAVAENGWTLQKQKNYGVFERRVKALVPQLVALGVVPAGEKAWNPGLIQGTKERMKFGKKFVVADFPMEI